MGDFNINILNSDNHDLNGQLADIMSMFFYQWSLDPPELPLLLPHLLITYLQIF